MVAYLGYLGILLYSVILLALIKFFYKFWWVPRRIKYVMNSQKITGPRYNFIHGNTKEISMMRKKSMSSPMETSHYIFPRIQPFIDSCFRLYGRSFVYWHGPQAELVVTQPELLKEIMSDKDISMGRPDMGPFFKKIHSEGILLAQGEKWVKHRKLATHAFHGQRLKNMIPSMIESVQVMLKRWKDSETKEMDVYEEFKILTSDVISRTAFGSSYEEGKQVFEKLGALGLLVAKNSNKIRLPGFGKIFKDKDDVESDKLHAGIRDVIMTMIRNLEKNIDTGRDQNNSATDYLGVLLNARHDVNENAKLSIQDIIGDCKTFYSAGHGMTSMLLSWVTLLLGIHGEWQEKVRVEVQKVFGTQMPSEEGLAKLKIMGMIINETLRLYPPAVFIIRRVPKKTEVGNLILPANINVQIPVLALHHDPKIWGEDADFFKPERFMEGVAKATNNNPGAFVPFGYGPRNCVGSNFAINEAKITLSMILQRYTFTLSPRYIHAPILQLVALRPQSSVQIIFQPI